MVIPELISRVGEGGVYLGVGPEQNFTYIAALKPRIAFILDVRRGNRDLHLMYKALFELATNRAEFVSLLFSRAKPADLPKDATAVELFAAFDAIAPVDADYERNLTRIKERLVATHQLPLSNEELKGIEYVYSNFFRFGPGIGYVGNFSGPKALRVLAAWLRDRNAKVSAYYLSNVEDYLSRDGTWLDFCRNAATLPLAEKSSFIRTGTGYRPTPMPPPQLTAISRDQVDALASKGGGTMTMTDGRVVTVVTNGSASTGFTVASISVVGLGGMNTSRLGLIADDLAPCAPPKGGLLTRDLAR